MTLQKNVASQKIQFLMVDATDFATPETGVTVTAKYNKDGGGLSTCSNSVSEITSGLYVITLAQTETNADVVAYQMTGTGCADQWLIFYPEDGYAAGISDIISNLSNAISTLDGPIDSAITQNTALISDVLSTIDGPVISDLAAIETDTGTTLENRQTSVLNAVNSTLEDTKSILSTLDGPILSTLDRNQTDLDAILTDTGTTLENRTVSILARVSDVLSTIDGPLDSAVTQNTGLISDVLSTIDGPVISDLSNIESIVVAQGTSGSADWSAKEQAQIRSALGISGATSALQSYGTNSRLDNATYGLDALETITSQVKSTIDGPIDSAITQNTGLISDILSTVDGPIDSAITQNTGLISDVLSTIDGPVISDLSNIESICGNLGGDSNNITSILEDTKSILSTLDGPILSTLDRNQNDLDSILADTQSLIVDVSDVRSGVTGVYSAMSDFEASIIADVSDVHSLVTQHADQGGSDLSEIKSQLARTDYGLDALETIVSDILSTLDGPVDSAITQNTALISDVLSTIDGPVISDLAAIETDTGTTLENRQTSILNAVNSAVADTRTLSNATYGLSAIENLVDSLESTIDGPLDSAFTQNTALLSDILSTIDGAGIAPTTTEPAAGAPAVGAATGTKIDYLYTAFRNKIETTSGTQKVYDDAGTVVLFSCAVSDDATTFTKGEHA